MFMHRNHKKKLYPQVVVALPPLSSLLVVLVVLLIAQSSQAFTRSKYHQRSSIKPVSSRFDSSLLASPSQSSSSLWSWLQGTMMGSTTSSSNNAAIINHSSLPTWENLQQQSKDSSFGRFYEEQLRLREQGEGLPHTDAKLRLFGSTGEPRVTLFRDTAAWCPYCQKVWILLEEKKIPYRVEKINMRSYGDKPAWFLQMVPNGLLPAIKLDGNIQTESLEIMLNLDRTFAGSSHPSLWPEESNPLHNRAVQLMRLERDLFARWCSLVFRSSYDDGKTNRRRFEEGLDLVNQELQACAGPWFLPTFSIVDLTYITHIERMCASVAYWCGFKIRGNPRWNAIDAWMEAFEQMPSYMATKSDYYTHVMDIPPQYGQPYPVANYEVMANQIDGKDTSSWRLPLKDFDAVKDVEPIGAHINPGEELARQEAAYKLLRNYQAIARFALRATGSVGKKRFQAPLADPYAEPNLAYEEDMLSCLKLVASALLEGNAQQVSIPNLEEVRANVEARVVLVKSLTYLRERVGVPRDMSYPAARQFRAHLNWMIDQLQ